MKRITIILLALSAWMVYAETCQAQLFGRRVVSRQVIRERGRGRAIVVEAPRSQNFCSSDRQRLEVFGSQRIIVPRRSDRIFLPSGLSISRFAVRSYIDNGQIVGFEESPLQYSYSQSSYQQPQGLSADDIANKVIAKLQLGAAQATRVSAIERNCLQCHGATNPKKGFSVIGMTADDSSLAQEMVLEGLMPKGKRISADERLEIVRELRGIQ